MQQVVVGAACIVFIDLAPVALGDAAQMLRLPVAMFVERRKAVIPIKTIRAADPPGLKIERGSTWAWRRRRWRDSSRPARAGAAADNGRCRAPA